MEWRVFTYKNLVSFRPTFRRIIRNQSTEQFSELPCIYALLNCLICLWYGMPFVTPGVILVATVNSIGAAFQFIYAIIFIIYADKSKKVTVVPNFFLNSAFPQKLLLLFLFIWARSSSCSSNILSAEDVSITHGSICVLWYGSICDPEILGNSFASDGCWIFKCLLSHFNVCFTPFYNCKSIGSPHVNLNSDSTPALCLMVFIRFCGARIWWSKPRVLNTCHSIFPSQRSWRVSLSLLMECSSLILSFM